MSGDALGDRMKRYEARETGRTLLPKTWFAARIDGRCFSAFTRGMGRPYDPAMFDCMDITARYLVRETHAVIGYTQSDEINILFAPQDEPIFGGRVFKLTSVLAGMASAVFALHAAKLWPERCARHPPAFDCRAFELPSADEAMNLLVWRELDATKNAVSMAARSMFSHKRVDGKKSAEMQEMMFQEHGVNFNDYPARFKRGAYFRRERFEKEFTAAELERIPERHRPTGPVIRSDVVALTLPPILQMPDRVARLLNGHKPGTPTA